MLRVLAPPRGQMDIRKTGGRELAPMIPGDRHQVTSETVNPS